MATNKRWRETKVVFKWIGIKPCIDCWLVEEKQKLYLNVYKNKYKNKYQNRWRETKVVFK